MKRKQIVATAFGFAGLASASLLLYARDFEHRNGLGGEVVDVLVAAQPLTNGTQLNELQLTTRRLPAVFAPARAIPADKRTDVLGSTVGLPLKEGDVLLWSDLKTAETRGRELADLIPEGARALVLPVTSSASLGELLRPNDHVDILGTFNEAGEKGRTTFTLLQDVTVLAVGHQVGTMRPVDGQGNPITSAVEMVTVCVTPEEAELLTHAMDRGKLSITLRNQKDLKSVESLGEQRFASLFEPETRRRIQMKRDSNPIITIIKPRSE